MLNHNYFLNAYSHNSAGLIYYTAFFEVKNLNKSPKKEGKSYFDRKLLGHIEKIPHGEIKGKALS